MNKINKRYTSKKISSIITSSKEVGKIKLMKKGMLFSSAKYAIEKLQKTLQKTTGDAIRVVKRLEVKIVKKTKPGTLSRRILSIINDAEKQILAYLRSTRSYIKPLAIASIALILFSASINIFSEWDKGDAYAINVRAEHFILEEKEPYFGTYLEEGDGTNTYKYNEFYDAGSGGGAFSASPEFRAEFSRNPAEGYTITDIVNDVSVSFKPTFSMREPKKEDNRLIYPLVDLDGTKVLTLSGSQVKEDIIIDRYQGNEMEFTYQLELPAGTEARLEVDGSLSIYGVDSYLLGGNVTTASEEDEKLLDKMRENNEKKTLLFRIPAPFILEEKKTISDATAWYVLEDNTLTLHASGLENANYPLSIDPSIYVETARKLMRGNNETNTDFDVDNELIQKSQTTGARIDSWTSTMDLNDGRWNGGTTVAGGFIYAIGGEKSNTTTTKYTISGAHSYVVPAGVTSVTVKVWGAGGGGGGGGTNSSGFGGAGGGGGFVSSTLTVTPSETLSIYVGAGGGAGDFSTGTAGSASGDGGGGGGRSYVERSGAPLLIAAGGGGAGGGDNSSATDGGAGGAGGGTAGTAGSASSSAPGGGAGTSSAGGAGGNGSENDGSSGASESGGDGADGRTTEGIDGSKNNGGVPNGGAGGNGDEANAGFAGGGGGGDGYYGGGGGSSSIASNAGGGGGGGGSSYTTGSSPTNTGGSGTVPGNDTDSDRGGVGDGGAGGLSSASGVAGDDGLIQISYSSGTGAGPRKDVYWAQLSTSNSSVESPNPGAGVCTDWCTDSSYDLPDERVGFSTVAYNGFLYVIGGEDSVGARQSTIYISKLGVNGEPSLWHPTSTDKASWTYWYSDTGLSTATSYLSAVAYNNRMYILGGQTSASIGGVTTVQVADILPTGKLGSWTTTGMQALPTGAGKHMGDVQVYNDTLYTIGGFEGVSTSSANLRSTVYYSKLASDGTMSAWQSTDSFTTARASFGGTFSYIWGAYIYLGGGCSVVNASGYCTTMESDMQLASINADGSLDRWTDLGSLDNTRIGYSLIGWQGGLYRLGGCTSINATTGECERVLADVDYGVINPAGEVSTVNITEASGTSPCSGTSPQDCDLPPSGSGAGQGGQMLSSTTILNGYLYVIGGCTGYTCGTSTGNVSYVEIGSDGSLQQPSTCSGTSYGAWCVDSTNVVNSANGGISAAGITTFNNRIYLIGGIDGTADGTTSIYYNSTNADGSLAGAWSTTTFASAGITGEKAYTYAYARANPASAGTNPGNLYIIGGCSAISASAGCSSSYNTEVYKCNITTTGSVSGCSTTGQLQLDTELATETNQGLGLHSGTVYANYIYLVGGYSDNVGDRDTVFYAKFDDSNNIVDIDSGTVTTDDDDWIEASNTLSVGRRRGWAFGYNGHIYAVGGYDDTGTGIIPFIEWSKMDVSDGSIDPFVTSSVTINQRWGLSMVVSNSYAYVIGGCDVGSSPSGCSSFERSIQTFQLYNNDSGSIADFTAQTDQTFTADTDRWGASSVIYDGKIYVAGGCVSSTDCTETTDSVQYASISAADGSIGTWSATSMNLPQNRGWGHLDEAGGTLYWIGGQDNGGDEKSDVYYTTPESSASAESVFRTTTYKLNSTEFSGSTYTLGLNNVLEENYYVMIAGASSNTGASGSDQGQARVDGDPFGNLGTTTNSSQILLSRGSATNNWVGTVTVVECLIACGTDGFQLREVVDQTITAGAANTAQTTTITLNEDHTTNTVPFGGYLGGGLESTDTTSNDYGVTAGVRLKKTSTNQIDIERYGGEGYIPAAADITIYVVEWGSNWNVEEVNFENWDAGGAGVDATSEYATQTIASVVRDDTWVWKSVGTSETGGLGDGPLGKVLTLGDGVTQNTSETTVALGSYRVSANRDDTVYVMEHSSLATDYRKHAEANDGTSFTETVDAAISTETYTTSGNVTSTEGYRIPLYYYTDSGAGQAYARVGGWSNYHTASTTITADKAYAGNNQAGWWQSIDLASITYTPTSGDLAKWETASNGLPGDRTKFGAAVWNDRFYIVGGLDDSATDTTTVYVSPQQSSGGDIASAWASSTAFNTARSGAAVTAYANNLYLFGGYDGSNYLSDTQFTQINSDGTVDAWTNSATMPNPLSDSRAVSANGYIYLVGGRTATSTCKPKVLIVPISANTTIASGNNPTGVGEWYETNVRYSGDRYGAAVAYEDGKIYTMGGGCTAPLSTNRHYESTVNSQPQVAIYSRLIDTDTDVFPNSWLLNGLDNSIGARWTARYRTMNDTDGVATDCGSADMTTWGQDTDFGDVTLGDVAPYTPKDSSGTDINCARYFYFYLSIDASKTFGYPEDVNRGPTIADLSLFFTSDPSKRLRHGKTFTGGEQQPLDTPCRQTEDSDCPLP